jgi:Putative adhesin
MKRHGTLATCTGMLAVLLTLCGCAMGPAVTGSFDRSFTVSGPLRLDLANASGDVHISGSADRTVHVHGDVRLSGGFGDRRKRLDAFIANPPVEQKEDTIHIGKEFPHVRNFSINYTIEVPHGTQVTTAVASGTQDIRGVAGPVKVQSASGSIRVAQIERDAQLNTASGSVDATDVGDDVHANSASGNVSVANVKGDVRINAITGTIHVMKTGGRVEAETASGSVDVQGVANDVKAHSASGRLSIQGNPSSNCLWELKTASGSVDLRVPPSASFELSASAVSGDIRADVPIVIEEQGKHSLRAHIGNGGARVEVRSASGNIRIASSN